MLSTRVAVLLLLAVAVVGPAFAETGSYFESEDYRLWAGRIVGGETALPGQFPYQVSLRGPEAPSNRHFCGGSIIRDNWILTAAHCVINTEPTAVVVVVGAHQLHGDGTTYAVSQVVWHAEYNYTTLENDIALLRTTDAIEFNDQVQPISIGDGERIGAGISARASGWGRTYLNGPLPDELQFLDLTTLTNIDCRARHLDAYHGYIHDSTLCVYSSQAERGMCHGDSGGPLVSDGVLIGAVSWGYPCARGKPDGFTRVSSFLPWIFEQIGESIETTTVEDF